MIPHRCPVCRGIGLVAQGFYIAIGQPTFGSTSTALETCRSCWGTGILWGPLVLSNNPPITWTSTNA